MKLKDSGIILADSEEELFNLYYRKWGKVIYQIENKGNKKYRVWFYD